MGFLKAIAGASLLASVWAHGAAAQVPEALQVAQEDVPDTVPTSAFATRSEFASPRLSPDGSRLAFAVIRDGQRYLSIYNAETLEIEDGIALGDPDDYRWYRWVGDDRLLISMGVRDRNLRYYSRLLVFELGSRRLHPLEISTMSYNGDNVIHVDDAGEYVLVSMARGYGQAPDVWRFDMADANGDYPDPRRVLDRVGNVFDWVADDSGTVRIGMAASGNRAQLRYRSSPDDQWRTISSTRWDDEDAFRSWNFLGLRAGSDTGYLLAIPEGGDREALMEFDFASGETGRIVYQSETEDVDSVFFDDTGKPIAVGYSGDDYRREWIDPDIRAMRDRLGEALPGSWVTITDMTDDRSRMLVRQSGPADPGALYIFTPGTRQLDLFAEYRPQIAPDLLAEPRSIRYDARDGTSIQAYVTLPRGRGFTGLPLVVFPHGGPYGFRDTDNYDDMVQLLANRGYAVIQPNFRGSGGFGASFELLGNGQIGRAMQDDLDDAVAYLVDQGTVDPDRVCILGSSYGGFAAMWGVIRNPEIYRCAVSFAGVTHFERQLAHDSDFLFGQHRGRHWDRVDGDQTNFDLDDVSPAVQVDRLTRPLLLAHGEEDTRVPYAQYELMVGRARRAGIPLETMSIPNTGHGFSNPAYEQAYYDAVVDFLARHNPAD